MNLLPIVERELRIASRQGRTYWGRLTAGLAALVLSMMALATGGAYASTPQLGREAFRTLSVVAFFTVLGTAVRMTADALSKEKREGTLGFLFLTDLKAYDIVLGKLSATMLGAFYQFLAAVPALALPMLIGGVTVLDFARLVLALANVMFFAAAAGLLASALSRRESNAAAGATLLLLFFLAVVPLAGVVLNELRGPSPLAEWLLRGSPAYACAQAVEPGLFEPLSFWVSIAFTHTLGWGFLGLTCRALPLVWLDRPAGVKRLRLRERWRSWRYGDAAHRKSVRTRLLEMNPIVWLTSRTAAARWHPWLFISSVVALLLFGAVKWQWPILSAGVAFGVSYAVNAVFKMWISAQASQGFSTDRDQGALELLLSTPLTERELVRGQWLTLRRLFAAPMAVLWVGEAIWMVLAAVADEEMRGESFLVATLSMAGSWLLLPADVIASSWMALWKGVTETTAARAASGAQMRVLVLPWLAILWLAAMAAIFQSQSGPPGSPVLFVVLWFVCSVAADIYFGRRARRQLLTEMRAAAARRFSGDAMAYPFWRWLGQKAGHALAALGRCFLPAQGR